jgi:hypothetical protein
MLNNVGKKEEEIKFWRPLFRRPADKKDGFIFCKCVSEET